MLFKIGVVKNFAIFTEKNTCFGDFFSNKDGNKNNKS